MSTRRRQRLAQLVGRRTNKPFDAFRFGTLLEDEFNANLLGLTGDDDRDIVRLSGEYEPLPQRTSYQFEGYAATNCCRLWGMLEHSTDSDSIVVYIVLTKGATEACIDLFGKSGPFIGNRAMLARIFDLTVEAAISCNISYIDNEPYNDRVRAIYSAMGFENGERLDLNDDQRLDAALGFVEVVYDEVMNRHPGFIHPWPE